MNTVMAKPRLDVSQSVTELANVAVKPSLTETNADNREGSRKSAKSVHIRRLQIAHEFISESAERTECPPWAVELPLRKNHQESRHVGDIYFTGILVLFQFHYFFMYVSYILDIY